MKEKLKALLYSGEGVQFHKGSTEFDLLYKAICSHPKSNEKIGSGVHYFYIQKCNCSLENIILHH